MRRHIHSLAEFDAHLRQHGTLAEAVVQGIDLRGRAEELRAATCPGAAFLGAAMSDETLRHVVASGAVVLPPLRDLPFNPYRPRLYSQAELTSEIDLAIYRWASRHPRGSHLPVMDALARRLHDHAIDDALHGHLAAREVVAVMGGHTLERGDAGYRSVAALGRELARAGWHVTTGGGPGAMEAANLGAWLSPYPDDVADTAIALLAGAPDYRRGEPYRAAGQAVLDAFDDGGESLAVPTWFYGHEPTNQFASHIAKYFANSIREDGLLAIATRGVVFTPGSAGTIGEVFLDATQNHYEVFGAVSPMVFLGRRFFTETLPAVPLLRQLAGDRRYAEMIGVVDTAAEALDFLRTHPPVTVT